MPEKKPNRLPTTVLPERYEIRLTPDLAAATFAGEERVSIQVLEPVRQIVLNAAELEIQAVSATSADGTLIKGAVTLDADNEQATLSFPELMTPGQRELQIKFSGILNDKLHGFYRSMYQDRNGREKTLASTQFESTDARRAFPCWDEPAFKAVFQVTLVVDDGLTAISNARVIRETFLPQSGKKEVVFADSMKMSTYLVAFIVGEFEGTAPVMVGSAPLRVWSVPGKKHLGKFSQEIGKFSLEHFSGSYDIAYPGDKLDLIAIPDFASGAMENLGAITFRETALLVDEKKATRSELERVADVVSHENAHMWFGDLVTMKWWNSLWLNEAFATFMEMLAVHRWKPEWKRWESFSVSRAAAMAVDGLRNTRSIEFTVLSPEECRAMFDILTYEKGAAVLRMLEQFLRPEVFRDGIRRYLRKHEFGNTETGELWDALEEASREPVRKMMDSWLFQPGFPIIEAAPTADGAGLKLSQRRFFYLGENSDQLWHVPLMIRAQTDQGPATIRLLPTEREATVELRGKVEWVLLNEGGHGFYRVRYAPELLAGRTRNLGKLEAIERFGLV